VCLSRRHSREPFRTDASTRRWRRLELLILLVDEDDARLKAARFSIAEIRVGNDDDLVARHRQSRSRAVQTDDTGTGRRLDDVGRKTRAGVDIVDIDALVEEKARSLDQRPVDRDRTFIVQIRFRYVRTVDLAFHQSDLHRGFPVFEHQNCTASR